MIVGFAASLVFVLASWFALRQGWRFPVVLLFAGARAATIARPWRR